MPMRSGPCAPLTAGHPVLPMQVNSDPCLSIFGERHRAACGELLRDTAALGMGLVRGHKAQPGPPEQLGGGPHAQHLSQCRPLKPRVKKKPTGVEPQFFPGSLFSAGELTCGAFLYEAIAVKHA